MKKGVWVCMIVVCLAACSGSPDVTRYSEKSIFTDNDMASATLSVTTEREYAERKYSEPRDLGELSNSQELPALRPESNLQPESKGDVVAQFVLPGASGFVYYIRYQASATNPWSVLRANQATDAVTTIYSGQREIQSVGGSLDGDTLILSMRQTTATSDFEVYRLNVPGKTVQQLTDDAVDNTHVTLSANSLVMAWQQLGNNKAVIVLRSYSGSTSFSENIIALPTTVRQPSLSGNGRWLVFANKRADGFEEIIRYNLATNSYLGIVKPPNTTTLLDYPSISDSGDKIMWLRNISGALAIRLKDLTTNTSQTVAATDKTFVHPSVTADGQFATYAYSATAPAITTTVYTISLVTAQTAVVRAVPASPAILHSSMVWAKASDDATASSRQIDQQLTVTVKGNPITVKYLRYVPANFKQGQNFPLIIFLHGIGETEANGGTLDVLRNLRYNTPPSLIHRSNNPMCFDNGGTQECFVVLTPLHPRTVDQWEPEIVDALIDEAVTNFKVDPKRIHLTGLSRGGGGTVNYAVSYTEVAGLRTYRANNVASLVPIAPYTFWRRPDTATCEVVASGAKVWFLHNKEGDGISLSGNNHANSIQSVNDYNSCTTPAPTTPALLTLFNETIHGGWNQAYDPKRTFDITTRAESPTGISLYQWLLRQKRP